MKLHKWNCWANVSPWASWTNTGDLLFYQADRKGWVCQQPDLRQPGGSFLLPACAIWALNCLVLGWNDIRIVWKGDLLNCQNETGMLCAPVKTCEFTVVLPYWLIQSTGMSLLHAIPSMHPALLCWCLNSGIPINNDRMDIKKMDFSYIY